MLQCSMFLIILLSFNIVNNANNLLFYFQNGLKKETKILVEKNFRSFVFIYHSQCCFWSNSLPCGYK